ncbi:M15 family metallopeptidase [Gillisia sp. M10.2A]|uniref:D-alanyl-D-alanine dipeptidase n=1 Tax=Gillisia lutea TaxID=2909668 RepID=A0ABS9EGB2_9FLAO|nr:M15 family metallopeptidase [Gillisia lutea]MCF4101930.1 M15 family metallopeptidase [Gillisia lutea]
MKNLILLLFLTSISLPSFSQNNSLPEGFVHLKEVIPDIVIDLRYAGNNNFTGKPLPGYNSLEVITTKQAALALSKVQQELELQGYCLKIFDAYRPQRAVDQFMEWARKPEDTIMKKAFYPSVKKENLFELGYIATKSGHSRGSTLDLTIIDINSGEEMDMGSSYDFFGEISHLNTSQITDDQRNNRKLLKAVMSKYGFRSYSEEWWHFTLRNEPFPNTYFDFVIE